MFAGSGPLNHACDFWRNAIHFRPNCLPDPNSLGEPWTSITAGRLALLNTQYSLVAWALGLVEACPPPMRLDADMCQWPSRSRLIGKFGEGLPVKLDRE